MLPIALTLLGAGLAYRGSPRVALTVLLVSILLIPDTAFLQGSAFNDLPIYRIVLLAFAAGLISRVIHGRASVQVFRPTIAHVALLLWLAGAAVIGIGLSQPGLGTGPRIQSLLQVVDQTVLFICLVACVRLIGDGWEAVKVLASVFVVVIVIAATERLFGWSYGRWLLSRPGLRLGSAGSQLLEDRGGEVRVRGAAQFALGYAWVSAILLPALLAYVAHARSRLLWTLPPLAAATIFWSQSRSALPAVGAGVVLLVVLSGFRRQFVVFALVATLGSTALYLADSSLQDPFDSQSTQDSDRSRSDRTAIAFDRGAERPEIGHGLSSLSGRFQLHGLDLQYLTTYVELGMVGLTLLVFLLAMVLLACGRGLRGPPGRQRSLAAASTTGVALGIGAAAAYDFFNVPGSALPFWVIAAIGVANADLVSQGGNGRPDGPSSTQWGLRAAVPIVGLTVGLLVAHTHEPRWEWRANFESLPVYLTVTADSDFEYTGKVISEDICELIEHLDQPRTSVECRSLGRFGGLGEIAWHGQSHDSVRDDAFATVSVLRQAFPGFTGHPVTPSPTTRKAVWARTAPVSLGLLGVLIALVVPIRLPRLRRSQVQHPVLPAAH